MRRQTLSLSAISNLIHCSLMFQMFWSIFFAFAKFFFSVVNLTNCLKLLVETSSTSIPLSIKYLIYGFASIWYDVSLKVIHFRNKNVFHQFHPFLNILEAYAVQIYQFSTKHKYILLRFVQYVNIKEFFHFQM